MFVFILFTMMWFQDIGFHDQNNNCYCKQEIKKNAVYAET
jgi:hypothetical protein